MALIMIKDAWSYQRAGQSGLDYLIVFIHSHQKLLDGYQWNDDNNLHLGYSQGSFSSELLWRCMSIKFLAVGTKEILLQLKISSCSFY